MSRMGHKGIKGDILDVSRSGHFSRSAASASAEEEDAEDADSSSNSSMPRATIEVAVHTIFVLYIITL